MNICVYGASSNAIDKRFITATEELGRKMAQRGHTLVFGGGAGGMMGAAARGVYEKGGTIIGIAPSFFNVDGVLFEHCTEMHSPDTMRERKKLLEEKSDAFIVSPGGIGTFDEFFEILTLKQLGRHTKAIAIFNVNGYYDNMIALLQNTAKEGFMRGKCMELFKVFDDADALLDYLETYVPEEIDIVKLKKIY